MKKLIAGVRAFHHQLPPADNDRYTALAEGQSPDTLFIACADSRVVPAFIASSEPGELFTVRNVGNLIPRVDPHGLSVGDHSEAAAVEYATEVLHVTDIVVCGHSGCGAMAGLASRGTTKLPVNLEHWLDLAAGALLPDAFAPALGAGLAPSDVLSQRNVVVQLRALESYSYVEEHLREGQLRLHGWWFDIATARVHAFDPKTGTFVDFDQAYTDRSDG